MTTWTRIKGMFVMACLLAWITLALPQVLLGLAPDVALAGAVAWALNAPDADYTMVETGEDEQ